MSAGVAFDREPLAWGGLAELLDVILALQDTDEGYHVLYTAGGAAQLTPDLPCAIFLSGYEDEDFVPPFAQQYGLEAFCDITTLQLQITDVLDRHGEMSAAGLIAALNGDA